MSFHEGGAPRSICAPSRTVVEQPTPSMPNDGSLPPVSARKSARDPLSARKSGTDTARAKKSARGSISLTARGSGNKSARLSARGTARLSARLTAREKGMATARSQATNASSGRRTERDKMSTADSDAHSEGEASDKSNLSDEESDDEDATTKKKKKKKGNVFTRTFGEAREWYDTFKAQRAGYGPPYFAEYGGDLPGECNQLFPDLSEVDQLLRNGADPSIGHPQDHGLSPVHYAARFGNMDLILMLKRAGGDMDRANTLGLTPLSYACAFRLSMDNNPGDAMERKQLAMLEWLIDQGADPNHVDKAGFTPLSWAARSGVVAVVIALVDAGADVMQRRPKLPGNSEVCLPKVDILAVTNDSQIRMFLQGKINAILEKEASATRKDLRAQHEREKLEGVQAAIAARKELRRWAFRQRAKALEEEAAGMEFLKVDKATQARKARKEMLARMKVVHGVWRKEVKEGERPKWVFSTKHISREHALAHAVEQEAQHLNDSVLHADHKYRILAPRWKEVTGRRLLRFEEGQQLSDRRRRRKGGGRGRSAQAERTRRPGTTGEPEGLELGGIGEVEEAYSDSDTGSGSGSSQSGGR